MVRFQRALELLREHKYKKARDLLSLLGRYADSPYQDSALRLAALTRSRSLDTYPDEIAMIDAWAEHLGLSRWYEWTNFENVPQGYETS